MPEFIKANCLRDRYDGCGILVEVRDGAPRRVLGYSGHPALRAAGQPAAVQNRSWRFCLVTCRGRERGTRTREIGAPVPLYHAPGGLD